MSGKDTGPSYPISPIPVAPRFCTKIREVERYMILCNAPFVLKTPYSSSGRGLLWVEKRKPDTKTKNWIEGAFNKQGMISIESGLDKVQDFAMEFLFRRARYCPLRGIIRFNTEERGSYTGNILEEQSTMLSHHPIHGRRNLFPHPRGGTLCITRSVRICLRGLYRWDMLAYRQKRWIFRYSSLH